MDKSKLIATGLTTQQAEAYALLIVRGSVTPPQAASALGLTRTNAYKLLDKLTELGLATKERHKKSTYKLSNPLALASLVSEYRAEATAREEAADTIMNTLLANYYKHAEQPSADVVSGKQAVADAYRKQIGLREDIYFIHTDADIPGMGFSTMHEIRTAPARYHKQRKALMRAPKPGGKINYSQHERSNLEITWMDNNSYDAPVEWSVTKSSLLIILYANEPHAVLITDKIIATAFLQIWKLLNSLLKTQPVHQKLKRSPADR